MKATIKITVVRTPGMLGSVPRAEVDVEVDGDDLTTEEVQLIQRTATVSAGALAEKLYPRPTTGGTHGHR